MNYSKYNISSKIKDSDKYYIVNLLSGNADILSSVEFEQIETLRREFQSDSVLLPDLINKGYFTDAELEKKNYRNAYLNFLDQRDDDEVQIFFVPNYACNFACSYCYQDEYTNAKTEVTFEIVDSFFEYVAKTFAEKKKYITIFGGEPLLNTQKQKAIIAYIFQKASSAGIELSLVTNGFHLTEYIDVLKTATVREIQITLDGTEAIHNKRRLLKNGNPTFDQIVNGIDECLKNDLVVNLRMVVDKENINSIPDLANFAIEKGWTSSQFFKTQLGRNYELHHCQFSSDNLLSRISLYEELYEMIKSNPQVTKFYEPSYSISKFLFENGELPNPLFDSCPACKTEWAFDYTGHIYSCTATVGKPGESLGTFYPEIKLEQDTIELWQSRDVTEIDACKECNLQLACGGGCGSVAKNITNKICSPDCRPVKELLELGFAAYFE